MTQTRVAIFFQFLTEKERTRHALNDDHREQKRRGIREPVFHRHQLPEIENDVECWE